MPGVVRALWIQRRTPGGDPRVRPARGHDRRGRGPAAPMTPPFFTIGHSTRPIGEFVSLLAPNGIARVVDVRSFPRSRTNPQYNSDALPDALAVHGIAYEHVRALGGKRGRSGEVAEDVNGFW